MISLSWCDTAASTFGRLYGRYTPALPRRVPLLNLPLAQKKSLAGSAAGVATGALTAIFFWGWALPAWQGYSATTAVQLGAVSWKWADAPGVAVVSGGWASLVAMSLLVGLISGVVEALGACIPPHLSRRSLTAITLSVNRLDLGNIDDNLSLPIISGTVLWVLSKSVAWISGFKL